MSDSEERARKRRRLNPELHTPEEKPLSATPATPPTRPYYHPQPLEADRQSHSTEATEAEPAELFPRSEKKMRVVADLEWLRGSQQWQKNTADFFEQLDRRPLNTTQR